MYMTALSTIDNPYDPFDDFAHWLMYDKIKGHSCCEYLAKVGAFTNDMSEEELALETERAIDSIVANDPTGTYIKVVKDKTPV